MCRNNRCMLFVNNEKTPYRHSKYHRNYQRYYEKYLQSDKEIVLVGVGFSNDQRNIADYTMETLI